MKKSNEKSYIKIKSNKKIILSSYKNTSYSTELFLIISVDSIYIKLYFFKSIKLKTFSFFNENLIFFQKFLSYSIHPKFKTK